MIPEIAALSAAAIIFTHTPDIIKALLVFAGVFIIALPNAIVALKWGRYRRV